MQISKILGAGFVAGAMVFAAGAATAQDYPSKPITMIVPWGAGGGTDATARIIATLLEGELGVPVPVENRTGGSGVVGHSAIANAAPDGYTIGIATLEIGGMHYQGLTELDYTAFTPIGLYNSDPAAIFVRSDSAYEDVNALIEAVEASADREFKASGSAQGGVNHLAVAGMLNALEIPVQRVAWVPSEGAAPGLQDLAAGGVDFVAASLPEARALMDAGRIKPLAIFATERADAAPDLVTFEEATGVAFALGSWRGIAAPAGLDPEIARTLADAIGKVVEDPEYTQFMEASGYAMQWTPNEEFEQFMADSDAQMGTTLRAVGLAR
ncbi:Bug family tripartite tricarboxylate transporter substrate binding protein [Pelagibacterium lacus]|uniref:Tripartite tricarboxylate transporter substrate binding protein n=1 Tax=Pelagibacterium lacus TaxID=2282655 RepID=A0A369W853_9HYPH|nr:tripartite tricarboxylate transporter substrate binding protein [Pelagibacterium lacus]RDE10149.1 tripartite tricarboxylate transporter substrate binding protein [Pelagibacterium lacus]